MQCTAPSALSVTLPRLQTSIFSFPSTMSNLRDEYGNPVGSTIDEYGNPIRHDKYGKPIRQGVYGSSIYRTDDPTAGGTDTGGLQYPGVTDVGIGTGGHGGHIVQQELPRVVDVTPSTIHRTKSSSSSSSSSSEDDGQGGRRKKKGLKEKIKEKLPGAHKHGHEPHEHEQTAGYGVTGTGYAGREQTHREKKGIMEKINDKVLPGHHKLYEGHY